MKNLKKIALSLLVVGLAIGVQSFKNAESKLGEGDVYAQNTAGNYLIADYDPNFCITESENFCAYTETEEGTLNNVGLAAPYTPAEIVQYTTAPTVYLTPVGSNRGIYNPE